MFRWVKYNDLDVVVWNGIIAEWVIIKLFAREEEVSRTTVEERQRWNQRK